MQFLTSTLQHLRIDWVAVNTALVIIALATVTLLLQAQLRRLRRQSSCDLQRVFELLDLMRLDTQEQMAMAPTINPPAALPFAMPPPASPPAPPAGRLALFDTRESEDVDYRTAARLAETGTSLREIAERCGLASGEAKVLIALQQARAKRTVHA